MSDLKIWPVALVLMLGSLPPARAEEGLQPTKVFGLTVDRDHVDPPVMTAAAVSQDGKWLLAGGDDHVVRMWNCQSEELLHELRGHHDWIRSIQIQADGKIAASSSDDGEIIIWNLQDGSLMRRLTPSHKAIYSLCFVPHSSTLAAGGHEGKIWLFDANTGEEVARLEGPGPEIRSIACSSAGTILAAASRSGKLQWWDLETKESLHQFDADDRRIRCIAFSPDDTQVATGGDGEEIKIWDVLTAELLTKIPCRPGKVFSIAYCGKVNLAFGSTLNDIRIVNLQNGHVVASLNGHLGSVAVMTFDEQSLQLTSGSFDTTVRVWDLQQAPLAVARRNAKSAN